MKKIFIAILIVIIASVYLFLYFNPRLPNNIVPLTFEDLYLDGITSFVGKSIYLKTPLKYFDPSRKQAVIGLDNSSKYSDVSVLKLDSEAKEHIKFDSYNATMNLVTSKIKRYYIIPVELSNILPIEYFIFTYGNRIILRDIQPIVLKGQIRYRSPTMTEERAKDPVIIAQNNNPIYWIQTFEFVVEEIY